MREVLPIAWATWRGLRHRRVTYALGVIVLLFAVTALAVARIGAAAPTLLANIAVPATAVGKYPWLALAAGLVGDDTRSRVLPSILARPVSFLGYLCGLALPLLACYAGFVAALVVTMLASALLQATSIPTEAFWGLAQHLLATASGVCVFVSAGAIASRSKALTWISALTIFLQFDLRAEVFSPAWRVAQTVVWAAFPQDLAAGSSMGCALAVLDHVALGALALGLASLWMQSRDVPMRD